MPNIKGLKDIRCTVNQKLSTESKNLFSPIESAPKDPNGPIRVSWIRIIGYNNGQKILLGRRAILDFTSVEFFVPCVVSAFLLFVSNAKASFFAASSIIFQVVFTVFSVGLSSVRLIWSPFQSGEFLPPEAIMNI